MSAAAIDPRRLDLAAEFRARPFGAARAGEWAAFRRRRRALAGRELE